MNRTIWTCALAALLASGVATGCGPSAQPQPEVKLDPAQANKPFPKVGEPPTKP